MLLLQLQFIHPKVEMSYQVTQKASWVRHSVSTRAQEQVNSCLSPKGVYLVAGAAGGDVVLRDGLNTLRLLKEVISNNWKTKM